MNDVVGKRFHWINEEEEELRRKLNRMQTLFCREMCIYIIMMGFEVSGMSMYK